MKVILAGYNVDTEVLEDLKKTSRPRQDVTPETISASYARISRDPRSVDELRKVALSEENILPTMMEAVQAGVTVGEVGNLWRELFGVWKAPLPI